MIPIFVVMAVPVMPISMAIKTPAVIPVPVTIFSAMLVAVSVMIPFAFVPSVMMSLGCLVVVMVTFVSTVSSIASVTISPSVTMNRPGFDGGSTV